MVSVWEDVKGLNADHIPGNVAHCNALFLGHDY